MISAASRVARNSIRATLDFVAPGHCPACNVRVHSAGLCGTCWSRAQFVTAPICARCGLPFDYDVGASIWCGRCISQPPLYDRARAALVYGDISRNLILAFKHGDRLDLTPLILSWLLAAGRDLLTEADLVVPVPLHRRRLLRRRYNQSSVLAIALGSASGLSVCVGALQRTRNTQSQGSLSRQAREINVRGSINVNASARPCLAGRRVLLIDDVLTTGATATACARSLLAAGAARVDVLTLARVI
ncbi:MAG: ComF family protein [Alphaproteobacteria bacterium]|nr:ComF family protein [Alphaproteobacteria bacterium]